MGWDDVVTCNRTLLPSGVKIILKLYLSKSIVTDGKTIGSKEKVLTKKST